MSTKEALLTLLEENRDRYLSGQQIGEQLGISRAAICKAVKSLREQGMEIQAVTNRGYRLNPQADRITSQSIQALLKDENFSFTLLPSVPSTNSDLREVALQGAPEGTVVLARQQTGGRGRMGRSFFSPQDSGLYLSLLLRPAELPPDQSLQITTTAAAALCLAIEAETGLVPQIKWVNDLYLGKRKICGILTEAALSMETGRLDYAVLGLGLNLYPPKEGFPPELQSIAGALLPEPVENLKSRLTAAFLKRFKSFYGTRDFAAAARVYRSHCPLIGRKVLVGDGKEPVQVVDITDRCQLVLQDSQGKQFVLSYGEVSIVNL